MFDRDNRRADRREDTFLELVRDNRARLRKICRVYAESTEAQDDLYQDILVQLWRALPGYEEDDGAQRSTWVYRVALNTALDHERKRDVRRDATLRDTHPLWEDGSPPPTSAWKRRSKPTAFTRPSTASMTRTRRSP